MADDHFDTPSDYIIHRPRNQATTKRRRWCWFVGGLVSVGPSVVLSIFFPQVLAPIGLIVFSAVVAKVVDRVFDQFFKKTPE